ncbi:18905_t:CDS:2 [Funneliformis geosporum]|nr:18905_t:CDS:2 [Funneliformis geosporum]
MGLHLIEAIFISTLQNKDFITNALFYELNPLIQQYQSFATQVMNHSDPNEQSTECYN